jgi:DNA-binding IclR family transcriptional regulator
MGVVELARRLGRDKGQVSRMLRGLADAGYVEREPRSARYRLGARLFALAAHAVDERLRSEADILVEREAVQIGERVEVGIRSGALCLTLATAAPDVELRAQGWVGRTVPLESSAAGRALLFDHGEDAVARLLVLGGLEGGARPAAPGTLDGLLERLRVDRRRGWVLAEQEAGSDLVAVGAPVRDATRRIVAAVSASGPRTRLDRALGTISTAVLRAASELSTALGAGVTDLNRPRPDRPRRDRSRRADPHFEQPADGAHHE